MGKVSAEQREGNIPEHTALSLIKDSTSKPCCFCMGKRALQPLSLNKTEKAKRSLCLGLFYSSDQKSSNKTIKKKKRPTASLGQVTLFFAYFRFREKILLYFGKSLFYSAPSNHVSTQDHTSTELRCSFDCWSHFPARQSNLLCSLPEGSFFQLTSPSARDGLTYHLTKLN